MSNSAAVLHGPWGTVPIVQTVGEPDDVHEPDHKYRQPCPTYCHWCPVLKNPDGGIDVMPGCYSGAIRNDTMGCYCEGVPDADV